jgi:hypothetical protein
MKLRMAAIPRQNVALDTARCSFVRLTGTTAGETG